MNTSIMGDHTPDGGRTLSSPGSAVAPRPHSGGAGRGPAGARAARLAGGVAAVVCAAAVVSACSSAAPAPHRAAQSQSPVTAATAAPPAPAPAGTTPAAPAGVPRCLEASLGTTVSGYQIGGGQYGIIIKLTNTGAALIILSPGQSATSSVAFAGGWPHKGGASLLEVTPPNAYDHAVLPLSYGTGGGGGDIHATAMARQTTIYRGSPGGCGCNR